MSSVDVRTKFKTYVQGLDENLAGGIPQGHIVLLAGEAGTMKSSLAYYVLFMNAKKDGINGLYISLEQSKRSLLRQMDNMGFRGDTLGRVEILDVGEMRKNAEGPGWLDTFRFAVSETKRRMNYELLVIDSLGALELISNFNKPREDMFRLFEWLRSLDITTVIISEMPVGPYTHYGSHDADFLADGIIHLRMVEDNESEVHRRIRCVKMRETDHSTCYFSFLKKNNHFLVTRAITDF